MHDHQTIKEISDELRLLIPSGYDAIGNFSCFDGGRVTKGHNGLEGPKKVVLSDKAQSLFESLRSLLPQDEYMWDKQEILNDELRTKYGITYGPYSEVIVHGETE